MKYKLKLEARKVSTNAIIGKVWQLFGLNVSREQVERYSATKPDTYKAVEIHLAICAINKSNPLESLSEYVPPMDKETAK